MERYFVFGALVLLLAACVFLAWRLGKVEHRVLFLETENAANDHRIKGLRRHVVDQMETLHQMGDRLEALEETRDQTDRADRLMFAGLKNIMDYDLDTARKAVGRYDEG